PGLGPRARSAAMETLCARASYIEILLTSIEREEFEPRQLDPVRVKMLTEHSDANLRARAAKALASLALSGRGEAIAQYQPALQLAGNIENGRAAFRKVCAACHRLENHGYELAPNLAAMKARGGEAILVNVL